MSFSSISMKPEVLFHPIFFRAPQWGGMIFLVVEEFDKMNDTRPVLLSFLQEFHQEAPDRVSRQNA